MPEIDYTFQPNSNGGKFVFHTEDSDEDLDESFHSIDDDGNEEGIPSRADNEDLPSILPSDSESDNLPKELLLDVLDAMEGSGQIAIFPQTDRASVNSSNMRPATVKSNNLRPATDNNNLFMILN